MGDLWKRPGLTARDRSIVTVAALVARNRRASSRITSTSPWTTASSPLSFPKSSRTWRSTLAGRTPWRPRAWRVRSSATVASRPVSYRPRPASLLPLDEKAEAERATTVEQTVGPVSPGLVHYTGAVLFRNLWLRPGLAPRDRSLVTVSALVASGRVEQITFHLNRAMDNGLTKDQASEVLAHLAFYAGWPNVFSAVPVARAVFEKRPQRRSGVITWAGRAGEITRPRRHHADQACSSDWREHPWCHS